MGPHANRMYGSAPAVGFAKSLRRERVRRESTWEVPGPGQYALSEQYTRGPRCDFFRVHVLIPACVAAVRRYAPLALKRLHSRAPALRLSACGVLQVYLRRASGVLPCGR